MASKGKKKRAHEKKPEEKEPKAEEPKAEKVSDQVSDEDAARALQRKQKIVAVLGWLKRMRIPIGLFFTALFVRLMSLGNTDLWGDEITFVVRDCMPPLTPIAIVKARIDQFNIVTHFPFMHVIQNLYLSFLNPHVENLAQNSFLQRLPAVFCGSMAPAAIYMLGLRLKSARLAWTSALMMTFFIFPVFFSREAYVYAPLTLFSITSIYMFFTVYEKAITVKRSLWTFFSFFALGFSHPSSIFLLGGIGTLCLVMLAKKKYPGDCEHGKRVTLHMLIHLGVIALLMLPFFYQTMTKPGPNNPKVFFPPHEAIFDLTGKLFLGSVVWLNVISLLVLLFGVVMVIRSKTLHANFKLLLILVAIGIAGCTVMSAMNNYRPRYYTVVIAPMYLFYALGLEAIALGLSRVVKPLKAYANVMVLGLTGLVVGIHLFVFMPVLFDLKAKGLDYKMISDWVNDNVKPGQPFVMESMYELRYVSGYFPTPGRVPAVPFYHYKPADIDPLREAQKRFIEKFPEAPWIESARHRMEPGGELSDWDWPHEYYTHREDLRNEELYKMCDMGMWPQLHGRLTYSRLVFTPVWYDKSEDIERKAKERGDTLFFTFPDWACVPVKQMVYMRGVNGNYGAVMTKNLTNKPANGEIQLSVVLVGQAPEYTLNIKFNAQPVGRTKVQTGQLVTFTVKSPNIPPGQHAFELSVDSPPTAPLRNLLLDTIRFIPAGSTPPGAGQPGGAQPGAVQQIGPRIQNPTGAVPRPTPPGGAAPPKITVPPPNAGPGPQPPIKITVPPANPNPGAPGVPKITVPPANPKPAPQQPVRITVPPANPNPGAPGVPKITVPPANPKPAPQQPVKITVPPANPNPGAPGVPKITVPPANPKPAPQQPVKITVPPATKNPQEEVPKAPNQPIKITVPPPSKNPPQVPKITIPAPEEPAP